MLRSILLALDDTEGAIAARDYALALTRHTGAALTAAILMDRPGLTGAHEAVPPGAAAFKERRDAALLRQARTDAEAAVAGLREAADGMPVAVQTPEASPAEALLAAAGGHDKLVVGRDSTLGREEVDDGLSPTIEALLHDRTRPLPVVPPGARFDPAAAALVAYDGSLGALRAVQLFALLGLGRCGAKVLSVADDEAEAAALAGTAAGYLQRHDVATKALPVIGTHPVEALLAEAAAMPAGMLVMGAHEHTGLRALFTGSATKHLLRRAPCAIFATH
ncbi:MAG: universal stress protein [Alphaproteobacteria bacterium]|nr:universal stress protein [Alphaproteobacteria bacterium]